jgi:hypothetical protein
MRTLLLAALLSTVVPQEWRVLSEKDGVTISRRSVGGFTECVAVAIIDAPPAVAKAAIDDVGAHSGKMPYVIEERVIKRDARGVVVYTRTSTPFVSDRDYTLRITDASYRNDDGAMVYVSRYALANDEGPPPRVGVVRVLHSEGSWRFDAVDGGARTRATYSVSAEPFVGVPQWIQDLATRDLLTRIFGALRERVVDPRYQ